MKSLLAFAVLLSAPILAKDDYLLRLNNLLGIQIKEDGKEEFHQRVIESGEVHVPYLGLVKAKNKTCDQLASEIKAKLEESYFVQATVLIRLIHKDFSQYEPPRIPECDFSGTLRVFGNVPRPGTYEFPARQDITVRTLLLLAGGTKDGKTVPRIQIVRTTPLWLQNH